MKILVPGPLYEDSFSDNVATTLRNMGHRVSSFIPKPVSHFTSIRYALKMMLERARGERPSSTDYRILKEARTFRPDVVLAPTWDVHPEVLDELGRYCKGRRVLWWCDAPANSGRWGLVNPFWDHVYVKDHAAVSKLRLLGTDASFLPEAMNPLWHQPTQSDPSDDVVVAGNSYPFRQAVVSRLLEKGVQVALYGPRPPHWARPEVRAAWRGEYITRKRKSLVFGAASACLNTFSFAEGNSLNCRAFEIAGAGGLQLIEDRSAIAECFEPGNEILVFQTFEELTELLKKAKYERHLFKDVRLRAAARAFQEHTYEARLSAILARL